MLLNRLNARLLSKQLIKLNKSQVRSGYYEAFRSGDKKYDEAREQEWQKLTEWDKLSSGFYVLRKETKLLIEEMKEKYSISNSPTHFVDKEVVKLWDFNQKNNATLSSLYNNKHEMNDMNRWRTACDSDWDEGYSSCQWTVSPSGRGLFSGYLDTRIPQDGRIIKSGFAFLGCEKNRKSFYRQAFFDWLSFTHLIMRVRGDGRNWIVILNCSDDNVDITWFDRYQYVLFTHGGPYWQWVKIPFSRFYRQSKGYAQDQQPPVPLDQISQIGFLLADQNTGPFSLEIDYVGAMYESGWEEETIYEAYYHKENPWRSPGNV